jgi:hypothetical protein
MLRAFYHVCFGALLVCVGLFSSVADAAFDHAHTQWDALTKKHVILINGGHASQVDYAGMLAEQLTLKSYLNEIAAVTRQQYETFDKNQQLAFLINAYNAYTIDFVLTKYPDLESIRDLGSFFRSPWKQRRCPLLGDEFSLDDIEHGMIREPGVFDDPRIHMAVNCASAGCPALRNEAYVADRLDAQLEDAVRRFLSDPSRNKADRKQLRVSRIFKWYAEDFERSAGSVAKWLARYDQQLSDDPVVRAAVRSASLPVRYLDYDWSLNDTE